MQDFFFCGVVLFAGRISLGEYFFHIVLAEAVERNVAERDIAQALYSSVHTVSAEYERGYDKGCRHGKYAHGGKASRATLLHHYESAFQTALCEMACKRGEVVAGGLAHEQHLVIGHSVSAAQYVGIGLKFMYSAQLASEKPHKRVPPHEYGT